MNRFLLCFILCQITCVDLSAALPEVFTEPVDKGGCGAYMLGNGICPLRRTFFLFDVAKFESKQSCDNRFSELNQIELKYERNYATNMNMAVSAIKDAEAFLTRYFNGIPFDRVESVDNYASTCSNVDGCGWMAKFNVYKDMKRDKYVAEGLFRKQMSKGHTKGPQNQTSEQHSAFQTRIRNLESKMIETGENAEDLYVVATTNLLDSRTLQLGIRLRIIDTFDFKEVDFYNPSSKCVLVIMPETGRNKDFAEGFVQEYGVQVAFVNSEDKASQNPTELRILTNLIAKDLRAKMAEKTKNDSMTIDERIASFHSRLKVELFGPYHIDNLTLVEVVQYLLLRINRDLRPFSEFTLSGGVSIDDAHADFRYNFQIPKMNVDDIFTYTADQMHCTVTNSDGFIFFTDKSNVDAEKEREPEGEVRRERKE